MYNFTWVTGNIFIFGDEEYGNDLLKICIFQELKDILSAPEIETMIEEIETIINRKINEANKVAND